MNLRVIEDEKQLLTFEQSFKRDSIPIFLEAIGVLFICAQIIEFGEMPAKKSILRQMIDWLGTVWFLLEIVIMMMNEKRRALHDLLAGSVVIKDEYWTDKESRFQ